MANFLYLDVETVPAERARERLKVSVPSNYKDQDKIDAYKLEKAEKCFRDGALDAITGTIISIGDAYNDDQAEVWMGSDWHEEEWCADDERELLARWVCCSLKGEHKPKEQVTIVGHNVLDFDLPYLWQRCKILGIDLPEWFPSPNTPAHLCNVFDTMLSWSGRYGKKTSLKDLCWAFGIERKDIDGSEVYDLWLNGEFDKIAEHNKSDVECVRELHKRLR